MSDIFISYASEDRERAHKLANALQSQGWSVWWDRDIITGQSYDQVIERELNSAKSVVVLWSSHSVASEWVKNEAAAAAERGVLLPALIERVTVPLEFRRKQTADLIGWDGDSTHAGFQALCRGVSATIGGVAPNRLPAVPRSRWNRHWTLAAVAIILVALLAVYSAVRWHRQTPESTRVEIQAQVGTNPSNAHIEVSRSVPSVPQSEPFGTSANLLSAENGGRLLLAPSDAWAVTVDGKEDQYREVQVGEEAVFGFKDERRATFDTFGMLIPKSGRNPKEFELLAGDESPSGSFRTIGIFHPQNARVFQTGGWQDFKFAPVTAKYLKVKLRSNYEDVVWIDLYEIRLLGQLKETEAAAATPTANNAAVELADLVVGKYFGNVIADSKGSSRSDVTLTITKLDKWTVRITSDYPRLGTVEVTLTRAGGKIVSAGGNALFLLDPDARPLTVAYNPNGEVAYAGRKQ
ncbi:MAG TPA: TIR domain-containing protein [Candidatus Binatia bacterium]